MKKRYVVLPDGVQSIIITKNNETYVLIRKEK